MATTADPHHPAGERWKWQLVGLMFFATLINYMDRQTLGSVSKPFMREFNLNEEGFGWVELYFGVTFATTQLIAGAAADRLSIRWLYAGTLLLWSAAGFACGIVGTLNAFIMCRMLLAFGESFNWPCAVGAVRRIFPPETRSFANGIFHGGGSIGAIVTPLLVLALVAPDGTGWRSVFLVTGAVGGIWVIAWLMFVHGDRAVAIDSRPPPDPQSPSGEESLLDMLRHRKIWIAIFVGMGVNICWHFFRTWLPRILERDLGFTGRDLQWLLAGFYVCADLGGMAAGFATRRLANSTGSVVRARQIVMFGTASLCLLAIPGALILNPWVTIPLWYLVAAGALGGFPNYFNLAQDTSGRHAAQALGLTGAVGWYSVALLNPIVGRVADSQGTFANVVMVIGLVPLAGAIVGLAWPTDRAAKTPAPIPARG
ncbi:MAG: MFS transporter [Gemmataceae bacterium]|nr:MFS transporter [Gemmataceae bacterium]